MPECLAKRSTLAPVFLDPGTRARLENITSIGKEREREREREREIIYYTILYYTLLYITIHKEWE